MHTRPGEQGPHRPPSVCSAAFLEDAEAAPLGKDRLSSKRRWHSRINLFVRFLVADTESSFPLGSVVVGHLQISLSSSQSRWFQGRCVGCGLRASPPLSVCGVWGLTEHPWGHCLLGRRLHLFPRPGSFQGVPGSGTEVELIEVELIEVELDV